MIEELTTGILYLTEFVIPVTLFVTVIFVVLDILKRNWTPKKGLLIVVLWIFPTVVLFSSVISILQVALLLQEIEKTTVLSPEIKTTFFICINLFHDLIYVLGTFMFWYLYTHKIIPGDGSAMTRVKSYFKIKKSGGIKMRRKTEKNASDTVEDIVNETLHAWGTYNGK